MSGASVLARLAVLEVVICVILGPTYRKTSILVDNFSIKLEHFKNPFSINKLEEKTRFQRVTVLFTWIV